jgi:3-hydroxyacyl-[acyl-carrier-protein] dehydratase
MNRLKKAITEAAMVPVELIGSDKVSCRYCFSDHFIGFSGHFPGYPILPAFVQVLIGLAVIEEWKGRPFRFFSLEKAKFHIEIKPDWEINVQCREYEVKGKPAMEVKLSVDGKLAASFTVLSPE